MLEVRGVRKTFHAGTINEVRSLQGVDLTLEEGSFAIVIGTNGSGKTTLLNAVAGTFPLDEGSIRIAGNEVTHWAEHQRARFVGRVFQDPLKGTASTMTVAENIAMAAKRGQPRGLGWALRPSRRGDIFERIRRLGLGLESRLDNPIGTLSGGQRQALTLLMATWLRPQLLLLDEHTAALDPKSADQVIAVTEQLIARDRLTTLMVTHSMHQAATLGDRLIMMHKGRVIHDFRGAEKRRLRTEDLLHRFEEVRRGELLDACAAAMLRRIYV